MQIGLVVERTHGFSGADLKDLCKEAAMEPLRERMRHSEGRLEAITASDIPPTGMNHFESALRKVRPSVASGDLEAHLQWNKLYGSIDA